MATQVCNVLILWEAVEKLINYIRKLNKQCSRNPKASTKSTPLSVVVIYITKKSAFIRSLWKWVHFILILKEAKQSPIPNTRCLPMMRSIITQSLFWRLIRRYSKVQAKYFSVLYSCQWSWQCSQNKRRKKLLGLHSQTSSKKGRSHFEFHSAPARIKALKWTLNLRLSIYKIIIIIRIIINFKVLTTHRWKI